MRIRVRVVIALLITFLFESFFRYNRYNRYNRYYSPAISLKSTPIRLRTFCYTNRYLAAEDSDDN